MADEELFFEEMAGVKPLSREPRERLDKRSDAVNAEQRRLAASGALEEAVNPLVDEGVEPLDAWFLSQFRAQS